MKVKMMTGLSGPMLNLVKGDEHEFDNVEAKRLIAAGFAVEVEDARPETDEQRVERLKAELAEAEAKVASPAAPVPAEPAGDEKPAKAKAAPKS